MQSRLPWYDAPWLNEYRRARAWIGAHHPEKLEDFESRLRPLRTRSDFSITHLHDVLNPTTFAAMRQTLANLMTRDISFEDVRSFGRLILRNEPEITVIHESLVDLVSSVVGEPVEASYNFLSLYTSIGACDIHMDAPSAKWTLDLCIDQSVEWPISFSEVVEWPDESFDASDDWRARVKSNHCFTPYTLRPNEAIVFSGSSQWHYRDPIPSKSRKDYCSLIFFHFIPMNTRSIVDCAKWPQIFDLPDMESLELRQELS